MKYSVIMNVYNEEKNIEYALKSVKKLKNCNEILIMDMGSEDKTISIAKKYSARVIKIPYDKYFDNARKKLIDCAKNEWVFLLDADEIISNGLAKNIEKIVKENKYDAVYVPFINYFFGVKSKYGVHYPCYYCRLFKKNSVLITGKVHNYMKILDNSKITYISGEQNCLIHFSFNNINDWVKKRLRYIELETEGKNKHRFPLLVFFSNFYKFYFKEKNYQGGYDGFILTILQCISEQLANIKIYYENKNIDVKKIKDSYLK